MIVIQLCCLCMPLSLDCNGNVCIIKQSCFCMVTRTCVAPPCHLPVAMGSTACQCGREVLPCNLQVLPATPSDLVSRDRELISAQHNRAYLPQQQGSQDDPAVPMSKPTSFLSMDNSSQVGNLHSLISYDKMQGLPAGYSDSMQMHDGENGGQATWNRELVGAAVGGHDNSNTQTRARHTHQE